MIERRDPPPPGRKEPGSPPPTQKEPGKPYPVDEPVDPNGPGSQPDYIPGDPPGPPKQL